MHTRTHPVAHAFAYPYFALSADIDNLRALDHECRLFGYNRWRPFSLYDKDYLEPDDQSIRKKILARVDEASASRETDKIILVTMPRFMGTAFNPVSFYFLYDNEGRLRHMISEVNSTFGERHIYKVSPVKSGEETFYTRGTHSKELYVSPYFGIEGHYEFAFRDIRECLDIRINLIVEGNTVFRSRVKGEALPLHDWILFKTILTHPLTLMMTVPRILRQAYLLYTKRQLSIREKPFPVHPHTISTGKEPVLQKILTSFLLRRLAEGFHGPKNRRSKEAP